MVSLEGNNLVAESGIKTPQPELCNEKKIWPYKKADGDNLVVFSLCLKKGMAFGGRGYIKGRLLYSS